MENLVLNKKDIKKGLKIPVIINKELAYLCGVLAGDGSIQVRNQKHEYSIKCVGNPKDEKKFYHEVVGPTFRNVFGFQPTFKYHDNNTTYGFVVFSKSLVMYLTQAVGLPHGKKYSKLCIPTIFGDDKELLIHFIRGLFDTDGCISFKRKYRLYPYYPVISFSSKNELFTREIATALKRFEFKISERYNYKVRDIRIVKGYTTISRIELNGRKNFQQWIERVGFSSPKHLEKIKKRGKNSGGWNFIDDKIVNRL